MPAVSNVSGPDKVAMQYDDKFYDLDDDFICDDELDVGEEIATEMLYNTSELPSHISDSKLSGLKGPTGEMLPPDQVNREELIAAKLAKREKEKIANRFRVFTLADFEKELAETST